MAAGLLVGTGLGVCSVGCLSPEEKRAVSVADCVAQMALSLPDRDLPDDLTALTEDGLYTAVQVVRGVNACRRAHPKPSPDGGAP